MKLGGCHSELVEESTLLTSLTSDETVNVPLSPTDQNLSPCLPPSAESHPMYFINFVYMILSLHIILCYNKAYRVYKTLVKSALSIHVKKTCIKHAKAHHSKQN